MTEVIDLDALQPKAAIIRFKGQEITLNPPTTGDVLRLGDVAQKLQTISELEPEAVDATVDAVTKLIYKIIPALNSEALTTPQLLVLIRAISDMAIPPDAKELAERGITVDSDPKVG